MSEAKGVDKKRSSATSPAISNFAFLEVHDSLLVRLPALAERYLHDDPNTAILKLRQFAELLAQQAAARLGLDADPGIEQFRVIRALEDRGALNRQLADIFHLIRKTGNEASHAFTGASGEATHLLKHARHLAIWFHRAFGDEPRFTPGAFVSPSPPGDPAASLRSEVEALEADLQALRECTAEAAKRAEIEAELRRSAETRARAAEGDATAALELGEHAERLLAAEQARYATEVAALARKASTAAPEQLELAVASAAEAAQDYNPDEAETRNLIDQQLREVGWEADTENLSHKKGTRPAKGRNLAISEWRTETGPADYVLFTGLTPVGIVEAKRKRRNVASAIDQAKRYSRGYTASSGEIALDGAPWADYRVPFLFATNGRPFLRQLKEQSGIWFLDARHPANHPRPRDGWPGPDDLAAMAKQDVRAADRELAESESGYLPLRDYQHDAVCAVEKAIADGRREILVAMATGTGKTRTCIGLLYRLIKAGRVRRALFLVDRSALGEQAVEKFKDVRLENQQAFTDIYDVKELGDLRPESDTRLQIATVQGMVRRLLYSGQSEAPLSVDTYDCIVIDECHRGYTLDREMSDAELTFRSEADYISKYRRVLDHFDAVKVGLTATPALHTTEIFGEPAYEYSYRQAVVDNVLVDHEPPFRLVTKLGEDGMHWSRGEAVSVYNTAKGLIDLFHTPDEIDLDMEDYNTRVITESFNAVVCNELAAHIDPDLPGKTLVYCATDAHADMVVRLLKGAFERRYGIVDDDAVQKITGASDKPTQKIRHFKNEQYPSVAVTVDLLTTGIDVPSIVNLVFIRRVKSRILYEQMLGRATRRCEGLFDGNDKEVFHVYDAVDLYSALEDHTSVKPVVKNPNLTFAQLVEELNQVSDETAREQIQDQLLVKLQRKCKQVEKQWPEEFQAVAGLSPGSLVARLRAQTPQDVLDYFSAHSNLVGLLDRRLASMGQNVIVSYHEDELRRTERGYGDATRPEDYLESFGRFLDANVNEVEALKIVTTRPRDLTRQQLKEVKLALDAAGFSEVGLRTAYRETTNQDMAASIIGYIRQGALGTPLEPYGQRVARALQRTLATEEWTPPQRQWLERIAKQLTQETVVDREALNRGQFGAYGGYSRLNRIFDGKVESVLRNLHEQVWKESA